MQETNGLSKKQYWEQKVRTKDDVVRYYQLYHPEYPELLARAIAEGFERLLLKYNGKDLQQLTEDDRRLFKAVNQEQKVHWDPSEDIEAQKLEGKIALANKRLEELLND